MSDKLTTGAVQAPAAEPAQPSPLADQKSTTQPQYFCTLTHGGSALEAAAHAAKKPVRLTTVAVGDGNGLIPNPKPTAEKLVHEVYRREISAITPDDNDPNIVWIHMVIPADDGGFWIREFGVYAEALEDGGAPVLFAYGNHAPYYKLKRILGQAITHEISIPLILSSAAEVEIVVSESGYASRRELLYLSEIVQTLREPKEAVWKLATAVGANGALALPSGITYAPGKHLLQLFCDGLECYPGEQFVELDTTAAESGRVKLLFAAPAGSEFHVRVHGYSLRPKLPQGYSPASLETRLGAIEANLDDVADNAAYVKAPAN